MCIKRALLEKWTQQLMDGLPSNFVDVHGAQKINPADL